MPLINGLKMACEPCIRGHRSTKCNHASERLMVPVRKPGRPLSSCPHPGAGPCSCTAVTAAIPRKQKCHCDPKPKARPSPPSDEPIIAKQEQREGDDDTASTTHTESSNSKTATPSYRVQKQSAKGTTSRKQSVGVASLERMDASQLNILNGEAETMHQTSPTNGTSPGHAPIANQLPPGQMMPSEMGMMPQPFIYPMLQQQMASAMIQQQQGTQITSNGISSQRVNGTNGTAASCCGGTGNTESPAVATTTTSPIPGAEEEPIKGSCCSSKVQSPESANAPTTPSTRSQSSYLPNAPVGMMMPPFQMPIVVPHGMYPYYPHPTIFTYPPNYGSYLHPLQPDQWRQMMAAFTLSQPPMQNGYPVPPPMPYTTNGTEPATNTVNSTSHECQCGDSCQCVGCAAHPYNEATQNYVRSAWNIMADEARGITTNGNAKSTDDNGDTAHSRQSINGRTEGSSSPALNGTTSPPVAQTPSDTVSGTAEEQTLSENDFFFVSYPFGGSCEGDTASCPCGDDCQCIGCAIHNIPASVQADG